MRKDPKRKTSPKPSAASPVRKPTVTQKRARVTSLDDLRALAIFSVMFYHLGVSWLPSGHLGVVVFLVLTGYLVTSTLRPRINASGASALPRFWAKRLKRIWMPMAVMVVGTVFLCVLFNHVLLTKARPDVIPSLLLFQNVSAIVRNLSYFDMIGGPSPLTHLWYLGIDAQFCIIWAVLLLPDRLLASRDERVPVILTAVLAVASAVAMAVIFSPDADPTRVYYGLDTRAFSPLIGAIAAMVMPLSSARETIAELDGMRRFSLSIAGWVSLVAIILLMVLVPSGSAFLYRGGFVICSLLAAVLIVALMDEKGLLSAVFSLAPMRWIGARSYSLYLWHYPIFCLLGVVGSGGWDLLPTILALALSILAAELSMRFIERDQGRAIVGGHLRDGVTWLRDAAANRGGAKRRGGRLAARAPRSRDPQSSARPVLSLALCLGCAVVLLVAGIGYAVVPDETLVPEDAIQSTGASADAAMEVDKSGASSSSTSLETTTTGTTDTASAAASEGDSTTTDTDSLDPNNLPTKEITLIESDEERAAGVYDPVLIGDSVPGGMSELMEEYFPDALIDTYVGRAPNQMNEVFQGYLDQGVVGHVVIFEAFANNRGNSEKLAELIDSAGDREVFLVKTRIPEPEGKMNNEMIDKVAAEYDNVHVIDWPSVVAGHEEEWLYADGTHLRPSAKEPYTQMLATSIASAFVEGGGTIVDQNAEDSESADSADDAESADTADAGDTASAEEGSESTTATAA